MRLEEKVTEGAVIYIDSIRRDIENGRLEFIFVSDPESPTPCRSLTFNNLRNFSEHWDEAPDEHLMEQLIGLNECPDEAGVNYVVRLGQSEMQFFSADAPVVQELAQ